jgi:hypothetical protein
MFDATCEDGSYGCGFTGRQESSKNETAPLFSFGTADRFSKQGATSAKQPVPGPGAYAAGSSIGKQGDSTKGNSEVFGFGRCDP